MDKSKIEVGHYALMFHPHARDNRPTPKPLEVLAIGKKVKLAGDLDNVKHFFMVNPEDIIATWPDLDSANIRAELATERWRRSMDQIKDLIEARDTMVADIITDFGRANK